MVGRLGVEGQVPQVRLGLALEGIDVGHVRQLVHGARIQRRDPGLEIEDRLKHLPEPGVDDRRPERPGRRNADNSSSIVLASTSPIVRAATVDKRNKRALQVGGTRVPRALQAALLYRGHHVGLHVGRKARHRHRIALLDERSRPVSELLGPELDEFLHAHRPDRRHLLLGRNRAGFEALQRCVVRCELRIQVQAKVKRKPEHLLKLVDQHRNVRRRVADLGEDLAQQWRRKVRDHRLPAEQQIQ